METFGLKEFLKKARQKIISPWRPRHPGFNLGAFFKQRAGIYDSVRGKVGCKAGLSMTPAEQRKRAERRRRRKALYEVIAKEDRVNPPGSKRVRRYAKAAGFTVDAGEGKSRAPTAAEAIAWYDGLLEAAEKEGHQGFRCKRIGSPLTAS